MSINDSFDVRKKMSGMFFECHVCRKPGVDNINAAYRLLSVTSDCKPMDQVFEAGFCHNCGCVVGAVDKKWWSNVNQIYENYEIYDLSGGIEKVVFNHIDGVHKSRSDLLVGELLSLKNREENLDILDIGAGSGVFLQAISKKYKNSNLYAQDLNDISLGKLENISGFRHLFVCDLTAIDQKFSIISMVHVLEHVCHPIDFLKVVRSLLKDDGVLVINVPDIAQNPLDLPVYDHCTHFTKVSLEVVLKQAGFRLYYTSNKLIAKENVIIATPDEFCAQGCTEPHPENHIFNNHMAYLNKISEVASAHVFGKKFHVFGTASASVWITNYAEQWEGCFVDEDPNRQGKTLLGRRIVSPSSIEDGHFVFVPFAHEQSNYIKKRLSSDTVTYVSSDDY